MEAKLEFLYSIYEKCSIKFLPNDDIADINKDNLFYDKKTDKIIYKTPNRNLYLIVKDETKKCKYSLKRLEGIYILRDLQKVDIHIFLGRDRIMVINYLLQSILDRLINNEDINIKYNEQEKIVEFF